MLCFYFIFLGQKCANDARLHVSEIPEQKCHQKHWKSLQRRVLRHQISTTIKHKILRVLHTFGALSLSAGLVCCRRKKDVAIRQNLRRVLPVLRGQRQRKEHLIAAMMIKCPTLAMPQSYRSRYGCHATPFLCDDPHSGRPGH